MFPKAIGMASWLVGGSQEVPRCLDSACGARAMFET